MRTDTAQIRVIEGEIEERCTRCNMRLNATPTPAVWMDDEKYHVVCARAETLDRTAPPVNTSWQDEDCERWPTCENQGWCIHPHCDRVKPSAARSWYHRLAAVPLRRVRHRGVALDRHR